MWRWALILSMLALVGGLAAFVQQTNPDWAQRVLRFDGAGRLAPLLAGAVFVGLAIVGAPVTALIGGLYVGFAPLLATTIATGAYAVSAALCHGIGRRFFARAASETRNEATQYLLDLARRRPFFASFIARWLPLAPFGPVNIAFGAAATPFLPFLAGALAGGAPKILAIALGNIGFSLFFP
ncbi:MAG TPA: hypothetical protein DCZ49_08605 [Hyphomonadaceae bacterium]|nr:hypothetical protein [Hyphomonadaceae bacterium]